ncbi:MAG TPA: hypothetical protein VNZ52_07230, partial [Candidatus Thermoplasmatota archaeon]|nr:hypothetical protein [Candidatus Thermoplasmatota archaeon]
MATTDIQHYFETQGMRVALRPTLTGATGETHTPDLLATGEAGTFYVAVHETAVAAPDTVPLQVGAQDTGATPVLVGLKGFTPEAERWAARFGITLLDAASLQAALAAAPAPVAAPEPAVEAPSHAAIVSALLAEPTPAEEPLQYVTATDSWDLAYEFPTHEELKALTTPAPEAEAAPEPVAAEAYFVPAEAAPEVVQEVLEAPAPEVPTIDLGAIVEEVAHILQAVHEELPVEAAPEITPEVVPEPIVAEPVAAAEPAPEVIVEAAPEILIEALLEAPQE